MNHYYYYYFACKGTCCCAVSHQLNICAFEQKSRPDMRHSTSFLAKQYNIILWAVDRRYLVALIDPTIGACSRSAQLHQNLNLNRYTIRTPSHAPYDVNASRAEPNFKLRHLFDGWLPVWLTGNGSRACVQTKTIRLFCHYTLRCCVHRFGGTKSVACHCHRFVATGKRTNEWKIRIKIFTMCRGQLKRGDKTNAHTHTHIICIGFGFGPYATIYTVSHFSARTHTVSGMLSRLTTMGASMFVFQVNFGAIGSRTVAICSNGSQRSMLIRETVG